MEKMKPCPFCGNKNISVRSKLINCEMGKDCPCSCTRTVWAYCEYCGCEGRKNTGSFVYYEEIIAAATDGWNRRFNIT